MTPDYKPIEDHLKKIDYLYDLSLVKTWFGGKVIGFNVSASSLIRKNYTLQRIQEEVEKNNMPLIVDDCWGAGYVAFRLMLKL